MLTTFKITLCEPSFKKITIKVNLQLPTDVICSHIFKSLKLPRKAVAQMLINVKDLSL